MPDRQTIFQRTELLLGRTVTAAMHRQRVLMVGVGGVGSWCAESLVRSGIGHLTLVDMDVVCESNVNRQLMATQSTIGQPKAEVLRMRLHRRRVLSRRLRLRDRCHRHTEMQGPADMQSL